MKTLLAFCLIGAAFASCGTIETMTAESNDTTVVERRQLLWIH